MKNISGIYKEKGLEFIKSVCDENGKENSWPRYLQKYGIKVRIVFTFRVKMVLIKNVNRSGILL